jgi:hypothetical protein
MNTLAMLTYKIQRAQNHLTDAGRLLLVAFAYGEENCAWVLLYQCYTSALGCSILQLLIIFYQYIIDASV